MSNQTIGKLNWQLSASHAELAKDFQQAKGHTSGFVSSMQQAFGKLEIPGGSAMLGGLTEMLGGAGSSLAGLAGPAGIAIAALAAVSAAAISAATDMHSVLDALEGLDAAADAAEVMGTSIEQMQKLGYAAVQSDTSMETLVSGMNLLQRELAGAASGNDESIKTFAKLGLNFRELSAMDPAESFKEVAGAIAAIPDPAQRAAASFSIFGKKGLELQQLLNRGKDGINAFGAEAERLGIVLSDVDAQTADAAKEAQNRLDASQKALASQWALLKAPIVTAWTDFKTAIVSDLNYVFSKMRGVEAEAGDSGSHGTNAEAAAAMAEASANQLKEAAALVKATETPFEKYTETLKKADDLLKAHALTQEQYQRVVDHAKESLDKLSQSENKLAEEGKKLTEELRTPLEKYGDTIAHLNELIQAGAISWETYGRAAAQADTEVRKTLDAKEKIRELDSPFTAARTRNSAAGFAAEHEGPAKLDAMLRVAEKQLAVQQKFAADLHQFAGRDPFALDIRRVSF